jgi:phthiodiolone/phenolphthiodiolone dimycocerosates ketoreductase
MTARRQLRTALPFDNHRSTPLPLVSEFATALDRSGVVDYLWLWDELSGWFPRSLWTAEHTPAADHVEPNSTYDPFVQAAFALAKNPSTNVRLSTDAIRSGPAELLRRVLTVAGATSGEVVLAVGAGELRQTKPFGHKRSEGLKRLEDTFVLVRKLLDESVPFSHAGNIWHYENATLGTAMPARRPAFWALGGGPKLLDIAARHADGFEAMTPSAITTPEAFGATVRAVSERVEAYGRDPDSFGFGIWLLCVMHEDPAIVDRVLENPLTRYFAGMFGRLDQQQWLAEGFTPIMPEGWHYATRWSPFEQSEAEVADIVRRVPLEMARRSYHCGSPSELASLSRAFVDAGADFIGILDLVPLVLGPAEAQQSMRRGIDLFTQLKGAGAVHQLNKVAYE